MNISGICPYETPCGWCSKWDKKCDEKIGTDKTAVAPCANCENHGANKHYCSICWAHNFESFKAKENRHG